MLRNPKATWPSEIQKSDLQDYIFRLLEQWFWVDCSKNAIIWGTVLFEIFYKTFWDLEVFGYNFPFLTQCPVFFSLVHLAFPPRVARILCKCNVSFTKEKPWRLSMLSVLVMVSPLKPKLECRQQRKKTNSWNSHIFFTTCQLLDLFFGWNMSSLRMKLSNYPTYFSQRRRTLGIGFVSL